MSVTLRNAGIADTVENNEMIINNLFEAAKSVDSNTTEAISYIKGSKGTVQVVSRWQIGEDGKKYMATIILKPIKN